MRAREADKLREVIAPTITDGDGRRPATWAVSNRDETRHATRYGPAPTPASRPRCATRATPPTAPSAPVEPEQRP